MHVEWHGNRIRVVRLPPSMVAKVGTTKLEETLNTTDPLEAEREKGDVIERLRASLDGRAVIEPSGVSVGGSHGATVAGMLNGLF